MGPSKRRSRFTSPTTVSRGGTVRLSSTFQANAAISGVNVKLDVRDSTDSSTIASNPLGNQGFTQGQTTSWYVWSSCAAKFTVQ